MSATTSEVLAERYVALVEAGRPQEALDFLDKIAEPDANALLWRGYALVNLNRLEEALTAFSSASQLAPDSHIPYAESAKICSRQGDTTTALVLAQQANRLGGETEEIDLIIGQSLYEEGRPADALNVASHMLTRWPKSTAAHNLRGGVLRSIGQTNEAVRAFDQALALDAMDGAVAYNRFALRAPDKNDARLQGLLDASRQELLAGDKHGALAEFALGRALEAHADFDGAFDHYSKGAAFLRRHGTYDEASQLARFEAIKSAFTTPFVRSLSGHGERAGEHVFVVGMPRSGTTLVEQILSSHSQVISAGEVSDFARAAGEIAKAKGRDYPEFVPALEPGDVHRIGQNYSNGLKSRLPPAARIVDKMPGNFLMLGLIRLALPNAKIIHCRRDPLDTCISLFTRVLPSAHGYSHDLGELGRYYRAYRDLMNHWRDVLGGDAFLDVDYEELVGEPTSVSRRIVEYCGLVWDARCLEFYNSSRQVRTASAADVRRPIYKSAIGRAGRYEAHLAPLREGLTGAPR
jgi:tetratricopeptide (TPR) repeat protein